MSGRISLLVVAFVVLTGQQQVRSQSTSSANGFDLVNKAGDIRKPTDVHERSWWPSLHANERDTSQTQSQPE